MGVEEAVAGGRVDVELGVGVRGDASGAWPAHHSTPRWAELCARQASTNWNGAAGLEGAVREVAVIARRDAEHAEEIQGSAEGQRLDA